MVTEIDPDGVTVKVGEQTERIATRTVVWAAGVHTAAIAETLAMAAGASTDRGGRIEAKPDLSLPGHPKISGDRRRSEPGRRGWRAVARARDNRDSTGAPRRGRDLQGPAWRDRAVQILRQRHARRGGVRPGSVRGAWPRALRPARVPDVPRRASLLPSAASAAGA
jgi:hypothetical protein